MIGKLRAYLAERRRARRMRKKQQRQFTHWRAANPGGTYAQFYVAQTRKRLDSGGRHLTLGNSNVNQNHTKARALRVLEGLKRAGCLPHHVVVDYGCGSLWIGETLMGYLDPGNYVGLDISDTFYLEGLTRLSPDFVAARQPVLGVIGDETLRMTHERAPDFILSMAVLHHVPPEEMRAYFARMTSLANSETRIEIGHPVCLRSRWHPPRHWHHGRFAIRAALAPLGYALDYRPERRIVPAMAGFGVVRR